MENKGTIIKFRGKEYEKKITREYLVQRTDPGLRGIMSSTPLKHIITLPNGKEFQADFLFAVDEWAVYEKQVKERFSKHGGLANMNKLYVAGRDGILKAVKMMFEGRSKGLAVMYPFFKKYLDVTLSAYSEIYIQPWVYDAHFLPYVRDRLQLLVGAKNMEKVLGAVSLPRKLYAAQKAQLEVIQNHLDGKLEKEIGILTKKWCWLSVYNLNHKPLDEEYFYGFTKGKTDKELTLERNKLESLTRENEAIVEEALNQVTDKELRALLSEMNDYSFARTERVDVLKQAYYSLTFFFEELRKELSKAHKHDCSFNEAISFTTPEIIEFVERGKLVSEHELQMRSNTAYAYYYEAGNFELLTDKKELDHLRKVLQPMESIQEIRGKVAFAGKLTGKVRIVTSMKEASLLKEGEIMVSQMTFPEYIHAMQKAAAFITDEGGITCHAAIISREMKKPCIIATKIATQVLKDGDLIEVNGETGVIKVLVGDNNPITSELKKYKLERFEVFPPISVASWEYACQGHLNNKYYKRMLLKQNPCVAFYQKERFEAWIDESTRPRLKDRDLIEEIIRDSLNIVKIKEEGVKLFLEEKSLDSKKCLANFKILNNIFKELYQGYLFFTEEFFDTTDQDLLKKLPEVRMNLSDFATIVWNAYYKILDFVDKKYNISRSLLDVCSSSEIESILSEKKIDKKELEGRAFCVLILDNKATNLYGKKAEEIKKHLDENNPLKEAKDVKSISGRPAFGGIAKGEVIKLTESDYNSYEKILSGKRGYVLVAPMTRPEIAPFLKNAIAIITDEGGITCHAAIIAREMKIPCIVGTKIATKVLKDGDLVEVDATNGIIRRISNDKR